MKTIIVNKGRSRQGKSKTIIKTAELLKQQYANAILFFAHHGQMDPQSTPSENTERRAIQ